VKPAMLSKKKHYLSVKIEPFGLTIENVVNQSKMSCVDVFTQFPQEPCKICDGKMGYYSNEFGQSECKQCASGKTVNITTTGNCFMEEHQFLAFESTTNEAGDKDCPECDAFTSRCTDEKYCSDCPTGKAGEDGRCDPCKAGRYINAEGQTTCLECPVGEYQDQSSQTECKKCNNGTMSSVAGGTNEIQCSDCLSGQYQAAEGQASCVGCPTGQSQPGLGKTACVPCVAGTYGPSTGLNEW
jgi:hypothetical protein